MKKRVKWIDQIKGFAIICMVVSHSIPGYDNALRNWITAFNMPLFFFLSGVLGDDIPCAIRELPSYLKKKIFSYGIPYLFFSMLYSLFIAGLSFIAGNSINLILNSILNSIKRIICMLGIQSMWFLPVFFFAGLFDSFVMKRMKNKTLTIVMIVLCIILLILMNNYLDLNMWVRLVGRIMTAEIFIILGRLTKSILVQMRLDVSILGILIFTYLACKNGCVSIDFLFGEYPVLFFINAIALSFFLCTVFNHFSSKIYGHIDQVLCDFGKNSIVVLVTNNVIIETFRLLDYKLLNSFCLNHGLLGCLLFALLILIAEYPLIRISTGKLAFLFGKRRISA